MLNGGRVRRGARTRVVVPAVALFASLIAACPPTRALADGSAEEKIALGRKVFTDTAQPPCRTCHSLKDIQAAAEIGAQLEELQPTADQVAKAVREGVGVMPSFQGRLTDKEIEAVAYFVSRVTGARK